MPASHKIADSADQLHRSAGPDIAGCIPLAIQMSGPSSSTAGTSRAVPAVEDASNLARKLML